MTRRATFFSLALMALMTLTAPVAQANVLVTDLSKDQISIRGDFTGETLLLFGAIDPTPHGPVDGVVVVLRGPGESVT
ncbi:MAG: TIGR02186 family protein, partial [Parvibaculales bacterium]